MKRLSWLAAVLVFGAITPSPADAAACEVTMRNDATAWLAAFSQRWSHDESSPLPVSRVALEEAEKDLAYVYPPSYRDAILAAGLPSPTADLWDAIDEESGLPHLSDFLTPEEAVETVGTWRPLGYPNDLAPFATDSLGNLLSFRMGDASEAVFLWDHDFGTTEQVAPSFAALLEAYCALSAVSD